MRICRLSQAYPTREDNGKGLHAYYISNLIKFPTLVITKYYGETYYGAASHVEVVKIPYWQHPFPAKNEISFEFVKASLSYVIGTTVFMFKSLPHILRFKPNIIHLQSPHYFITGLIYKILQRCRIAISFHGGDLRRIKSFPFYLKLLRFADLIFYVDSSMKDHLKNHFEEGKLFYTPSGVDLDFYKDLKRDRRELLVAIGNLRWEKGYDYLIDAMKLVNERFPGYRLIIIGEGRERQRVQDRIDRLKLADTIELLGRLDREAILSALNESYCLVLSSVSEGLPKVVLEALACNTPVVVTDVGGCREISGGVGICVEPRNSNALAEAICRMIMDKDLYAAFKENCPDSVQKYSWDRRAEFIERIFMAL